MKVVVFGSTGGTGREVVKLALAAGHEVTAVARDVAAVFAKNSRLSIVQGDVLRPETLAVAFGNQDAVVFAVGTSDRAPTKIYSQGVLNVLGAMKAADVSRILCVSAGGLDPSGWLQKTIAKPILWSVFKNGYTDMVQMEATLRSSEAEWTILRPPRLTTGPRKGKYRVAVNGALPGGWSISRADLADFIVTHLGDSATHRSVVEIAY